MDTQTPTQATGHTKEKVSIDTKVADSRDESLSLSSPDGIHSEASSQCLDKLPLRESSSAFLASLTSASDIVSPLTSAFPSTDSLQSSEPGREDYRDVVPHRDSMIEMAMSSKSRSVTSPYNSSVSTSTSKLPTALPLTDQPADVDSTSQHKPINHETIGDKGSGTPPRALSPSRSARSTPGEYFRHGSYVPAHDFYSSGKHDEEYEQSHSRTPLLPPIDYPPPKETDQAIKDYSLVGNKLINQYETLAKLGSGAHGTVKLGRDKQNDRYVAIKVVRRYPKKPRLGKQESPEDKVKKEVAVLKKAQHPHVVTLLEVIDDPRLEKVYLILEFVERGEIKWRKSTEREIANFEMNRVAREMAGNVDEAAETEHLMRFNEHLFQHYLERLHTHSVTNSSASDDDVYDDYDDRHIHPMRSHHSSRPASRPSSQPPSDLDISAIHTLRIPSRASSHRDAYSIDQELSNSIHGSYVEEEQFVLASDFERERWLKDEPSLEQQWTPAEEEYRFVPCLTLSEARDVFRDTVLGLEYLHFHSIIHRDIKPANLLWTKDYRVKISDFGVSYLGRPLSDEENNTDQSSGAEFYAELAKTVGTPAFYAPELCDPDLFDPEKNVPRPRIGPQIDVWALGVTLYAMVYGRLAFWDQNEFTMYEKIAHRELFVPAKRLRGIEYEEGIPINNNKREEHVLMYEDVDDDLKDLLQRLLIKDPTKRITIKEVKYHPWLLHGVPDPSHWVSVTDPSDKTQKIEVSQDDLREAVVPRTFLGKMWNGLTNMTRGRVPSRRRAETSGKNLGKRISSSLSRSNTLNKDQRRSSLRGDEVSILDILRSTRDPSDQTSWQGTMPGSIAQHQETSFPPPLQQVDSQGNLIRPTVKQATTTDTILTVKIRSKDELQYTGHDWNTSGNESVGSSSSSLAKIMDSTRAATRRLTSKARGHEARNDDVTSLSSRASSGDNIALPTDIRPLKPSLAVSPALAAGHVELPSSLLSDSAHSSPLVSPVSTSLASTDSFQSLERGRTARKRASTATSTSRSHISVGSDEAYRVRPGGHAGLSGTKPTPPNHFLPLTSIPRSQPKSFADVMHTPAYAATSDGAASLLTTGETITPAIMKQKQVEREEYLYRQSQRQQQQKQQQDKIHQQKPQDDGGGGSDDDEGIVMGGVKK